MKLIQISIHPFIFTCDKRLGMSAMIFSLPTPVGSFGSVGRPVGGGVARVGCVAAAPDVALAKK